MTRRRDRSGSRGQALVEMLVVLPVLFLLLLAAADVGKLFVISGKSEIAARYIALSHFREAPFGDAYAESATQEIAGLFFNDALNDHDPDDTDVTYEEIPHEELGYAPGDLGDEWLNELWEYVNTDLEFLPMRGARSTFAYDLPRFPFGREHPMEIPATPAASYDASGNFVMLANSFSGEDGEQIRLYLELAQFLGGLEISAPAAVPILMGLWIIFLP